MTGQVQFQSFSGGHFSWIIGGQVNNEVRYQTRTVGSGTIVTGAEAQFIAPQSGWVPLELQVVPWVGDQSLRCQVALEPAFSSLPPRWSEVLLPAGGALFWVRTGGMSPGMCQIVVLHNSQNQPGEPPNLPVVRTRPSVREEGTVPFSSARSEGLVQEGKLLFEESMTDLTGRFREVRITTEREPHPPDRVPPHWLDVRITGNVLSFVDTHFSDDGLDERLDSLVRGVRHIDAQPMGLRSIFTTLARAARDGGNR